MRIACPHCQAIYEVVSTDPDVSFVCARCHREFRLGESLADVAAKAPDEAQVPDVQLGLFDAGRPAAETDTDTQADEPPRYQPAEAAGKPPLFLERLATTDTLTPSAFEARGKAEETPPAQTPATEEPPSTAGAAPKPVSAAIPEEDADQQPTRRAPRVLSWLSLVMMLIAVGGFAYNHQSWAKNIWLRSILLNLHAPITVHASDWRIPPKSVHAEWLKRDDGSAVLVIEGRVDNRLHAELATPWIEVTVYDAFHSDKTVKRKTLPITLPPAIDTIRHAPWTPPPQDNVPVAAAGSRGFILVMDDLPKHAGEFTLDVVPSLFR